MIYVSLAINAGIIAFSKHENEIIKRDKKKDYEILIYMIIVEHIVFFMIFAISKIISSKPKWLIKKE